MGSGSSRGHRGEDDLSNQSLEYLVHQVVSGQFELDALNLKHTLTDVTKDAEDDTRPLKSVATDFVVNEFFKTEDTLYRFLTVVYDAFENALGIYRKAHKNIRPNQLFFLYKGGNILRIVSREFLLELPSSATKEIAEFYSPFFQRSDADFSIYIDPQLKNYDQIYHEITLLAYLVQDKLRHYFDDELMLFFNFFQYNRRYQSDIMIPYLVKFNEALAEHPDSAVASDKFVNFGIGDARALQGLHSFDYKANPDTTIRFININEDWQLPVRKAAIGVIQPAQPGQIMTITHNDALDFSGGGTVRIRFNLTRTKFIFTLLKESGQTQNVGGELIDVSIPHRRDSNTQHFFDHIRENVVRYHLRSGDQEFPFNSYSIAYLSNDLENILFNQRDFPWLDKKYKKRINRLMYLYFIDIFIRLENAPEKLQVLRDAREWAFKPMTSAEMAPRSIAKRIGNFSRYEPRNLAINTLMVELLKLLKRVEADPSQRENLSELGQSLVQNVDFLVKAISKVRQYCSVRDGKVERRDLYSADMTSLT